MAYGFEDGIGTPFYRRSASGTYHHIVRVFPVLRDSSRADSLFWGYPWGVEDLATAEAGDVLATFEHDLVYDGVDYERPWHGAAGVHRSAPRLQPASLSALRRRACAPSGPLPRGTG